jgi:hypothetical protein
VKRALVYAGELALEVIPKITRPGQLLQIVGIDNVPEQVIAGQPFLQQNGQAQPAPMGAQPGQSIGEGLVKFFDLSKGRYSVTVDIGNAEATRRVEESAALGDLIPQLPPAMAMTLVPEYIENLPIPNAHALAETARRALPPELQPPDQQHAPLMQLQQENQQLKMQLQQLGPLAQKNQADLMKAQLQEQGESQRAVAANQVALQRAEIAAAASMSNAQAKVDAENFRSYVDALESRLAKQLDLHMNRLTAAIGVHQAAASQAADHVHDLHLETLKHQQALAQMAAQPQQPSPQEVPNGTL